MSEVNMRGAVVTLAILLSGSLLTAQQHAAPPPPRPAPAPPPNTTTFTTPTPPPTVLPQAPVMPPVAGGFTSGSVFPPQVNPAFLPGRPGRRPPLNASGAPYFYAPYPPDLVAPTSPTVATPTGMLRLTGTPESAQVFVDGYFVGTLGDIEAQRVLTLPAGPHRIEVRAADYDTTTFDVRISANETVTYRAVLEHVRPQPRAPAPTSGGATKMYLIPNCYLGNIPPKAERLPRGCDVKRVQIIS
jgi:PEGA domain-containing protein